MCTHSAGAAARQQPSGGCARRHGGHAADVCAPNEDAARPSADGRGHSDCSASTVERALKPGTRALAIEEHILETQRPAALLGIGVTALDEISLSLHAPLELNHNVHGTAFAGSLYALGVLCSYYLGREWLWRQGLADAGYELVAKAGSITYKRPVMSAQIVARSVLPSEEALHGFQAELVACGKASIEITGLVMHDAEKVACEYATVVCAYRPRPKQER